MYCHREQVKLTWQALRISSLNKGRSNSAKKKRSLRRRNVLIFFADPCKKKTVPWEERIPHERIKTNTILSFSNRLPSRTLLPVESKTSRERASLRALTSGTAFGSNMMMDERSPGAFVHDFILPYWSSEAISKQGKVF